MVERAARSVMEMCRVAVASERQELRDADEIVGDKVEQEVAANAANAAMLGLAHRAVLLAPAKDALDHRAT